jgi:hypothetical protein
VWLKERIREAIEAGRRQTDTSEQTFNWYR